MSEIYLLPDDYKALENELKTLQTDTRGNIAEATAAGVDDYDDALKSSNVSDASNISVEKIRRLQKIFSQAIIYRPNKKINYATIGHYAKLIQANGKPLWFHLGGTWMAPKDNTTGETKEGAIRLTSIAPVAKLLKGKKVGETIALGGKYGTCTIEELIWDESLN